MLQQLAAPTIFCHDFEACAAFYANALRLFVVERDDERGRCIFQLSGQSLLLQRALRPVEPAAGQSNATANAQSSPPALPRPPRVGRFTGICFETADIAQSQRALAAAGARFDTEPAADPAGASSVDFMDPDGNVLSLRQPAKATRTPEQQTAFETIREGGRGGVGGPFLAWSQHHCLPGLINAMGAYFLREGTLPARLRELAIITTARIWSAQIEWYAHVPAARRNGISADVVEAIAARRPPRFEHSDEAVVHRLALEINETRSLSDSTYRDVVAELGPARSVELIALLGFYGMTAMALNAFRLTPPPDATRLLPP
jgi:4-carboxymuconolactone decarboxylase